MMTSAQLGFAVGLAFVASCGGGSPPAPGAPLAGGALEPKVTTELRRHLPGKTPCEAGDVCGHFLQLVSPGSDPPALAERAAKLARGKCGGTIVVYKDARGVMGAGTVLPTADDKRACEKALGRPEDPDFPNALVWRAAP